MSGRAAGSDADSLSRARRDGFRGRLSRFARIVTGWDAQTLFGPARKPAQPPAEVRPESPPPGGGSLRLKSYFASSVEAAVALARQQLGGDAMILDARPAKPEARYLGKYEVVFGMAPSAAEPATRGQDAATGVEARPVIDADARALRQELARLSQRVERLALRKPWPPPAEAAFHQLLDCGFPPATAAELIEQCGVLEAASQAAVSAEWLWQSIELWLASNLTFDSGFRSDQAPRAVAVVGPPGSGKTALLTKIAARYGLLARRRTHLLSIDVQRLAAAEQLRVAGSVLGVGVEVVETPAGLEHALLDHRAKGLVLIDTPGFSGREAEDSEDLAGWLASRLDIEVHLVLDAAVRPALLEQTVRRFARFRPSRLAFTRIDETGGAAAALSLALQCRMPISFLGTGQRMPEDLELASAEALLSRLGHRDVASAAAGQW
ncbi:MAG: hypothetical protein K2X35_01925 [Bryobacteraceae bacterium]|nr:hypothetical protein [Bryobacteraceae bacterium]